MKKSSALLCVLWMDLVLSTQMLGAAPLGNELPIDTREPSVVGAPQEGACSNATADFVFSSWQYKGGARPFPGMITGEIKLSYRGDILGHTVIRSEGEGPMDDPAGQPWRYDVRFRPQSLKLIAIQGDRMSGMATYSQEVELNLKAGFEAGQNPPQFKVLVICENRWDRIPRP